MKKTVGAIALATVALTLGACGGGATVDNQNAESETVAPLVKSTKSASEVPTPSASSSTAAPRPGAGAAAPAPQDQAVQEVTAVPTAPERTEKEQRLLDELDKQGIKVDGVEDQMVSIADGICAGKAEEQHMVGAVSGQLVEQQRTDKKPEEVASMLVKTAKDAYC